MAITAAVVLGSLTPYAVPFLSDDGFWFYSNHFMVAVFLILAIGLSTLRRPRGEEESDRKFWLLIATGCTSWLLGQGLWAVFPDSGRWVAMADDLLYIGFFFSLVWAIDFPPGGRDVSPFDREIGSTTIAGGVVLILAVFVYFSVLPGIFTQEVYDSWLPSSFGSLFFDLYFAIRLFHRAFQSRSRVWNVRYRFLAFAFVGWAVNDAMNVAALLWIDTDYGYRTIADFIWYLPPALFLLAVLHGRSVSDTSSSRPNDGVPARYAPLGGTPLLFYAFLLPVAHLALYAAGWMDSALQSQREYLLLAETLLLAGLVHRASRLVQGENRRLDTDLRSAAKQLADSNRSLADTVLERTRELRRANRYLEKDIAERRATEQSLLRAQVRNEALIEALPDELYVVSEDGEIKESPRRIELNGKSFLELFSPEPDGALSEALRSCCRERQSFSAPASRTGQDDFRRFECRLTPLGECNALVIVQDITRRLQMEQMVQQTQQLESLGTLAGGVAHDFNNLLVGILGNTQLLLESTPPGDPAQRRLQIIEQSALRAAKLTDNLLAYSGKEHTELHPLDFRALLVEMEEILAEVLPQQCRLHLHPGRDPIWVRGAESELTQILLNLVANAGEALTDEGGSVWVMLDRTQIPRDTNSDFVPATGESMVRLRVRDEGSGMDEDTLRRIFVPFYSSKAVGRGLGMAAVLGIATRHSGTVEVDSRPGRGTEVTLCLPEETEVRPAVPLQRVGDTPDARRGRVLVADDEKDVRDLLSGTLQRMGFEVVTAADGPEAVEVFRRERKHLVCVILDYAMPRINGSEVVYRIRREAPRLPIVMISGYLESDVMHDLVDEDGIRFVHKPFDLAEFAFLADEHPAVGEARA